MTAAAERLAALHATAFDSPWDAAAFAGLLGQDGVFPVETVDGFILMRAVAETGVDLAHRLVVGQQDDDVALDRPQGCPGRAFHHRLNLRQGSGPGRVLDLDLDHRRGSSRSGDGAAASAS